MTRKEYIFESEADGLEISVVQVTPVQEPYRGIVQIVHGMCEYKERYLPFMEFLAQQGYVTVIHDHRGHGKSVKDSEDLGYMYGGGAESVIRDIRTVNERMHQEHPGLPLILFGHSMGSLAVRAYTRRYDGSVDMLIVCGSPSYNAARPLGAAIARGEKLLFGPKHRSRLIETLSFGGNVLRFRNDRNCTSWVCSDRAAAEEYERSPLCGFTFTDDGYLALFQLMKEAYDVKGWNCTQKKMPVLFISGADDPCMINVRHFARSVQAMRRAGYQDVKGKLYPGMRHEILNETKKEQVYHDIAVYMKRKGF